MDVKISRLAIACPSTAHVISVLYLTRSLLVDLWNYHGIIINQQSFGRGILLRYRPQTLHVFHTCVHHGHLLCQFSNSVYHSCHTSGEDSKVTKGGVEPHSGAAQNRLTLHVTLKVALAHTSIQKYAFRGVWMVPVARCTNEHIGKELASANCTTHASSVDILHTHYTLEITKNSHFLSLLVFFLQYMMRIKYVFWNFNCACTCSEYFIALTGANTHRLLSAHQRMYFHSWHFTCSKNAPPSACWRPLHPGLFNSSNQQSSFLFVFGYLGMFFICGSGLRWFCCGRYVLFRLPTV